MNRIHIDEKLVKHKNKTNENTGIIQSGKRTEKKKHKRPE